MLIKPIVDIRNPRHMLEDEDVEDAKPHPIPIISIDLTIDTIDNMIIIPKTLSILQDQLPDMKPIGSVKIDYPELYQPLTTEESIEKEEEEYDEDVQLYNAIAAQRLKTRYPVTGIPILANGTTISLTIPHFVNTITYNILARALVKKFKPNQTWIVLSPCSMNNNQSINRLVIGQGVEQIYLPPLVESIPILKPPHTITGISAAIISQLNIMNESRVVGLVLNSEGQPGFEKSDNDAIIDACFVIGNILNIDDKEYMTRVSSSVRKFNGYSNSGMYI
ncbi:uncharacterized protein J8A68_002674 [[Candida] subhashii]|uniref:Proteasome assembly chaperone 1 n=1 Tax=[Candida] subhashii TaxID=561895 RepID=A0A8J5V0E3_9ASCO|nr:uncharacterized protein J8A68_002674 [[Candida] subhashii]KAG7663814.1 hypothetical protein J8A68_002674 [[Candida] subhashii]